MHLGGDRYMATLSLFWGRGRDEVCVFSACKIIVWQVVMGDESPKVMGTQ